MKINYQSKAFWKLISLGMLFVVFFTFNQCVVQQYSVPVSTVAGTETTPVADDPVINSGTLPEGGSGEFEETGATEVAKLVTDVGVKDFEAIYVSFQVLTGINGASDSVVRNSYNNLQSQLPVDSSIKNFMVSNQIAIVKMASSFCDRLFSSQNYYSGFFRNFDITRGPSSVLSTQNNKNIMIQDFINTFWGENVQPASVEQAAREELIMLITDLLEGETSDSSAITRKVAKGVCTTMLASAPVTTL